MNVTSQVEATLQGVSAQPADPRCPFLTYHSAMGAEYVAGLLDYVTARQSDFRPGLMRNRGSGELIADPVLRDSAYLTDLGIFAAPIRSFIKEIAAPALSALHLSESAIEPREFEITAYRDGGHIGEHIDTYGRTERVRILSCVYYFAVAPRRFSGGELRLYGFPKGPASERQLSASFVDVEPRTDTLVIFPSWIRHQVMPVGVPSGAWRDSRFTINCWLHRASGQS